MTTDAIRSLRASLTAVAISAPLLAASCGPPGQAPGAERLAILNAKVWTGDPAPPRAQAMLIEGDHIVAVGPNEVIRPQVEGATVIDLGGKLVVPGFIDSHVHFLDGGFRLASVKLRDASSREMFTARVREFAESVPDGTWITGGDWDHHQWDGTLPSRDWIDDVTPSNPVWIHRLDGHMALANSLALEVAGITGETPAVEDGTIVKNALGEPTGILKDNAMRLVDAVVPPPDDEAKATALGAAMNYVARQGVSSVHHMGTFEELEAFQSAHDSGGLTTRVYAAVPLSEWKRLGDLVASRGRGDEWLRIGMLKGFVDGSLGSHTAAFHAPYDDTPGDRGLLVNTEDDLYEWSSGADRASLHVAVHAIGDRTNALLLDIYQCVVRENGPRDRRFRIEHAQHFDADDIDSFPELGIIASMQPYHAIDDGRWAEDLIGPVRIRTTYAFRSLLDTGAHLAFGSDWYVAPPTPIEGIYAAVTRRTLDEKNPDGWVPEQRITVEEALGAYTSAAAYASFEEDRKGMLKAGFLADFAVIEGDLFTMPTEEIRHAKVVMTVVGGAIVYRE